MATVNNREFRRALKQAMAVVAKKSTIPALESVMVRISGAGALSVTGTNLDQTVMVEIPAERAEPGALAIPARQLSSLLNTFPPSGSVRIEFAGTVATVACGGLEVQIEGQPEEEFPEFVLQTDKIGVVQAEQLYAVRTQVAYAAADDGKWLLRCVHLKIGERLEAMAADGFRLAYLSMPGQDEGMDILVQPVVLELFGKADRGDVLIGWSERMVHYEYNQPRSRLIVATLNPEGRFPEFRRLLPDRIDATAEVLDTDLFKQAVGAAAQGPKRKDVAVVTLEFADDELIVTSDVATTRVPAKTVHRATVKLDSRLVRDALNACVGPVHIMVQYREGEIKPTIFTDTVSAANYPDIRTVHLIMPVVAR